MSFREKLNSRKFILAVGAILLGAGLLVTGYIQAENFVTIVITLGSAYMATQAYIDSRIKRNAV